jgi:hypothetical protein
MYSISDTLNHALNSLWPVTATPKPVCPFANHSCHFVSNFDLQNPLVGAGRLSLLLVVPTLSCENSEHVVLVLITTGVATG